MSNTNTEQNKPLTAEQLAEIRARAEKATPGPWIDIALSDEYAKLGRMDHAIVTEQEKRKYDNDASAANARFIAHAREDIPAMLDRIAELEAVLRPFADMAADSVLEEYAEDKPVLYGHEHEILMSDFTNARAALAGAAPIAAETEAGDE